MGILKTLTVNGVTYTVTPVVPTDSVILSASAWETGDGKYYQVVEIPGVTPHTKVDLQPTAEQLVEFHHKVLGFVAENDGGTVTVNAIGSKPANDHTIQITMTEVEATGVIRGNTVGTTMPQSDWNQADPTKADYIKNKDEVASRSYVDEKFDELWADIHYKPMDVVSITNSIGTKELGEVVESATVSWTLNKVPVSQTLDGEEVATDIRSATVGPISESTKFTVRATDDRGATDEASTWAYFYNGIYYGAMASNAQIKSDALYELTRKLQSGRGITFTAECGGKRPVYACPERYGTPKFVISGFEYEWTKIVSLDFLNRSGYTERYDVWMHGQNVAGSITVTVS